MGEVSDLVMANSILILCFGLCVLALVSETQGECVDKYGCKKKIDQEGPGMCTDPLVRQRCYALCEAYKGYWKRSECVDSMDAKEELTSKVQICAKTPRQPMTAVHCVKPTRTGPSKWTVQEWD